MYHKNMHMKCLQFFVALAGNLQLYPYDFRKYIDEESAKVVVHAFVTAKLDSCNSLLYGLPQHLISRLQSIQTQQLELLHVLGNLII